MKAKGKAYLCLVACHLLARITKKFFLLLSSIHYSTLSLSLHCSLTACGSKYCMGCWHSPFDLTLPLLFSPGRTRMWTPGLRDTRRASSTECQFKTTSSYTLLQHLHKDSSVPVAELSPAGESTQNGPSDSWTLTGHI